MIKLKWKFKDSKYRSIFNTGKYFEKIEDIKRVVSKWDSDAVIELFPDFRFDEKGMPSGILVKANNCFVPAMVSDFGCGYALILIKGYKDSVIKAVQNWKLFVNAFTNEKVSIKTELKDIFYQNTEYPKTDCFYKFIKDKNFNNCDFGSLYNHFFEIRNIVKEIDISNFDKSIKIAPEEDLFAIIHSGSMMLENFFWEKLYIKFSLNALKRYKQYNSEKTVSEGFAMMPYNSVEAKDYRIFFDNFKIYSLLSRQYGMIILEKTLNNLISNGKIRCVMLSNLSHVDANNYEFFRGVQKVNNGTPVLIGGNRYSPSALLYAHNTYLPHGSYSHEVGGSNHIFHNIEEIKKHCKNTVGNDLPAGNERIEYLTSHLKKLQISVESSQTEKNPVLGYLYPILNIHQ